MDIEKQLQILNEVATEILLNEISALDTAKMLYQNRDEMKDDIKTSDNQRNREKATEITQDRKSIDPLVRRKAILQQQLAQVIKQIKEKEAHELRKQGIK